MAGVHAPACPDLMAHIDAAVRETAGCDKPLTVFVDEVRADWATERQLADAGDAAVAAYWAAMEADLLANWTVW